MGKNVGSKLPPNNEQPFLISRAEPGNQQKDHPKSGVIIDMGILIGVIVICVIFLIFWRFLIAFRNLVKDIGKFSENLNKTKGPEFVKLYRLSGIGVSITFVVGILFIFFLSKPFGVKPELQMAIEIVLYGILWTMAFATFIIGCHRILYRLILPGLLSSVVIIGSIVYVILSKDINSMHFIYVSIIFSCILLLKGFLGPIAVASSLSLAAWGIIHSKGSHAPLFQELVVYIIGQNNLVLEYLISIILALGALANFIKMDISKISSVANNFDLTETGCNPI